MKNLMMMMRIKTCSCVGFEFGNEKIVFKMNQFVVVRRGFLTTSSSFNSTQSDQKQIRNCPNFGCLLKKKGRDGIGMVLLTRTSLLNDDGGRRNYSAGAGMSARTIFSDWPIVVSIQDSLYSLNDILGMNWMTTIMLATLGVRLFIGLPVAIHQQKSISRLESLKPKLTKMAEQLKGETLYATKMYKWDEKTATRVFYRSYNKHWRRLVEENNCHPMKPLFLALTQAPVWICFSSAIRNIVYILPEKTEERISRWIEIKSESPLWMDNLISPDPILPFIYICSGLLNIQLHNTIKRVDVPQKKFQKYLPWVGRIATLGIGIFSFFVPSALSLYWTTSNLINLTQNIILKNPKVRLFFKIETSSKLK